MKIAGLIFLIIIAVGVIILCSTITKDYNQQQIADVLTIIAMTIAIVLCIGEIVRTVVDENYRYSAKDYRIETEVTTRGNISDTTYIITRR